jgi:hypothetical protein
MSELSEFLAGIDKIRLRQSRAIARIVDRQRAIVEEGSAEPEDLGYAFALALVAAATDRAPKEIEEMEGSILELGPALPRIMALAGFAMGEAGPPDRLVAVRGAAGAIPGSSPGTPSAGSGASGAPSPPAAATRRPRSAK